ncbi:FMR [Mytilus coruscus]|uniref:FMR n=1 Tax=Mytilus coruscus TaxID=42192 RepID=A0A6J8C8N0_MYTCO|nr:FMR [Mytilus coruscus]
MYIGHSAVKIPYKYRIKVYCNKRSLVYLGHPAVKQNSSPMLLRLPVFTGRVIGKNGNVINEVINKSLVKKIETHNVKENAVVTFNIIGPSEAIQRAVLMLNNKLDEIECINKRIQRRYEFNADKKKLSSNGGGENSFKGKYNVQRRQKQGKKPTGSKTPDEDCLVFFLKNKIFRRIDYDAKQKQKQRALHKLSRGNVKMQHQGKSKLSKPELAIDFYLLIGEIVLFNPSFTENYKQCGDQHNCSKEKKVKSKVRNYIIETDHGHINLTKARFQDNCLGKYIEAAIKNKGLNGVLKVGTWTDWDDDRGTCISLDTPEISNEKGEICFEKCIENESNRWDEQWCLEPQQTKIKAKVKNNIIETDHGQTNRTKARFQDNCLGKNNEAVLKVNCENTVLKVATWTGCDDDRGTCISLDSPEFSNEKGDICFEKCIENESNRREEQWWKEPQQTRNTWEMLDSDEESSISTELEQFKMGETKARSNRLSNSLTNQLSAVRDYTETLVAYNVGGIIETNTSDVENQLSSVEDSAEALEKSS